MSQFDQYSKRYKRALTLAILLFLGTLTASILVMILSTADRRSLEDDYRTTLTAISVATAHNGVQMVGDLPFRAHGPTHSAAESCTMYILTGLIRDLAGQPLNGINVRVWGDYEAEHQIIRSGEGPDIAPGRWLMAFSNPVSRRVWVQIAAEQTDGTLRYLSAPVGIAFEMGDCARYQAEIVFEQVAPME